ncbi:hypothetical protein [Virgibacillus sp. YIM 98842]|jgi:hypothetical protein|uniref:hypothetical protein n=1 Tax=Virgibacillus sp. YIM 98842 TaxID=2663533 RepID=UPI0013DA0870|nr:hypothetical protein [Virgibacillus sp. YIM 98842]
MEFLLTIIVYIIPFIILYLVIAAGVRRGIDGSDTGRALRQKLLEEEEKRKSNKNK